MEDICYNQKDIVDYWSRQCDLQEPERVIINELYPNLDKMDILDIGVGSGRTTFYLAPFAKSYLGIDIAKNMIKSCEKRFSTYPNKISFKNYKLQELDEIDKKFDLILFSYNGIDHVEYDIRNKGIKDIYEKLNDGGYFVFSTHNIINIPKFYKYRKSKLIKPFIKELLRLYKINRYNIENNIKNKKYLFFNDGVHNFSFKLIYIDIKYQFEELLKIGFKNIIAYDLNGNIINDYKSDSYWVYFKCEK